MKKHQPALLQKYMPQRNHNVGLDSMAFQDKGGGCAASRLPSWIRARSPGFTPGCSAGVLRKKHVNAITQRTPVMPNERNAPRQPNGWASAAINPGATAPPQRPNVHKRPWARPRVV